MALPRIVLRLVDPAGAYLERGAGAAQGRERGRPSPSSAVVTALTASGTAPSRPLTDLEQQRRRDDTDLFEAHAARLAAEHAAALLAAATSVLAGRTARVEADEGVLVARLIRFRYGDRVLEVERASWDGRTRGRSRTRVPHAHLQASVICAYLAHRLAQL